jgi:hypothetical protein
MDLDRRNLPIPRLPGHAGAPTPYNQIDAAKYDYTMKGAKRDAEGNLIPKSEGGGFNRDWGMTLKNAFLAASAAARSAGPGEDPLGKALGGALAGGVGSAINPQAGYEFAFDLGERPKMEAEMAREQAARDRANMEILNRAKLEGMEAETGLKRSQADKTRADIDLGLRTEDRQRAEAASRIALNNAEILAKQTGQAKLTQIVNQETQQIEMVWVYPDGRKLPVGRSGEAEIDLRGIKSREDIARKGEAAATGRTAMGEAGEDRRQQKRIDAERELAAGGDGLGLKKPSAEGGQRVQSGQRVTPEQLQRYAEKRKLTPEKARQNLRDMGYTVD